MNDIQDLLHHAVRDVETDPDRLSVEARRRGLAIRRRRQALGLAGVVAATALVLGGGQLVAGVTTPGSPGGGSAASSPSAAAGSLDTVPATGRTTAAALLEVLDGVDAGEATKVGGFADGSETYAEVSWLAPDDSGESVVSVVVRSGLDGPGAVGCAQQPFDDECGFETRPDGVERASFEQEERAGTTVVTRRVVDVLRSDGTRVTAATTNGLRLGNGVTVQTQTRPSLTYAQLQTIAEDPAFGSRMAARWVEPREPFDYTALDESQVQGWRPPQLFLTDCASCHRTYTEPPLPVPTTAAERRRSLQALLDTIRAGSETITVEPRPGRMPTSVGSAEPDPED